MHSISGCFIVVGILLSPLAIIIFDRANVDWSEFAVLLAFPVISLTFGFISVINNTQRGLVRGSGPELFSKHPSFLKRYWKRDLIGLLVMGLILMGIMAYEISKIPPVYAKNVSYEQMFHQVRSRFPKEGRDFCYFRGGRGSMVCEFTIDEQGFRNWITSDKSWGPCYPIKKDVQVEILPPSAFETGKRDWEENVKRPTITDGLHTSFGDKHIGRAVFDRTTNRVYYWYY